MRRFALVLLMVTGAVPAHGQVTVNQRALEQLGGAPRLPAPRPPVHHYVRRYYYRPLPLPPPYVPKPVPVIAKPLPPPLSKPAPPPKGLTKVLTMSFPGATPDLPPDAAQGLSKLVAAPGVKSDHFTIAATAPGIKGDPSVARRLALNRGLAVRARLRAAGVPSEHIIVQALGSSPGKPDDNVTLTETP
jgi:hypothetical protein